MKTEREALTNYFQGLKILEQYCTPSDANYVDPSEGLNYKQKLVELRAAKIFEIGAYFLDTLIDRKSVVDSLFPQGLDKIKLGSSSDRTSLELAASENDWSVLDNDHIFSLEHFAALSWIREVPIEFDHPSDVLPVLQALEKFDLSGTKLPFEYFYITVVNQHAIARQHVKQIEGRHLAFRNVGYLVTRNSVYMQTTIFGAGGEGSSWAPLLIDGVVDIRNDRDVPLTLYYLYVNLWRVFTTIDYVNSLATTVIENPNKLGFKTALKQAKTQARFRGEPPKDYYLIRLQNQVVVEPSRMQGSPTGRQLDHQVSVRGHYVLRALRGTLPIDPELEQQLKKDPRRKLIYSASDIDEEAAEIMQERGIRYQEGTWLSLLWIWRHSHIRGPKDAPYVPAIRLING